MDFMANNISHYSVQMDFEFRLKEAFTRIKMLLREGLFRKMPKKVFTRGKSHGLKFSHGLEKKTK